MKRVRSGGVARRIRLSDPGDDGPSSTSRFLTGCGVGCVALVLLIGALGLVFGAAERVAEWGGEEPGEDPVDSPAEPGVDPARPDDPPIDPSIDPSIEPGTPEPATQDEMARRYRPGPFAEVQSMVPSGRLLPPATRTQVITGRTVDNPWIVPGAELLPSPMTAPSAGGPQVSHDPGEPAHRPLTVLARTPSRVLVRARDAAGGTDVQAYLVDFVGYQGHFHLPATVPTELGVIQAGGSDGATVHFAISAPVMPDGVSLQPGQTFPVTMRVAAVDGQGRVSAPITRELSVMAVGAGQVEVTLWMSEPTDLDLYVTDPAGQTVYYGNRSVLSGGQLDLDANAACGSNMGVDNEHVYWRGNAPAGTFRVNVSHYESCVGGRPIDYRVTVHACGETVVLTGRFDGPANGSQCFTSGPGSRSWCQEVVTFDVPPCCP